MSCPHCDGTAYVKQWNEPKSFSVPCVCRRAEIVFTRTCGQCKGTGTVEASGEVIRCVGCAGLGKILAPITAKKPQTWTPPARTLFSM